MKLRITAAVLLCLLLSCPALAAQIKFRNVSLHDPSILRTEDGRFYIYGSHMQGAYTDDLMNFKMFSTLDRCTLQPYYAREFKEALTFAQTGTFWAPDVIQLQDHRYYMYYCCCEGSSPLSALGLAVSDSPEGPFENAAVLLRSGEPGYDATRYPNAIDPCVFFDASGTRLYMVYGSYSGGIFLLELDPNTGLILEGQEPYGIHLLGGNHSCIEAPYIVYNPDTEYYYLFLSFGGLAAADGYNIRVCRSRSVEGPYEDAQGQSMLDCKCRPGQFWNNDDIAPYGTKLMGGYLFEPLEGENSTKANAVRSPGHNSVYFDAQLGKWYIFHHTRFAHSGERYTLQVREMAFNEYGWPIVYPVRYVDESLLTGTAKLEGTLKVLSHDQDVNLVEHISSPMVFGVDGTISGEHTGSFELGENQQVRITLEGKIYSGIYMLVYDDAMDAMVTGFTAMTEDGETLWGLHATGQYE